MKYPGLKCLFLSLAVSLSFFVAVAQTTLPDSLQSAIDQPHLNDKEKSALLTRLAEIYRITNNYQAAIKKARQGVGIALKIHDLAGATKAYTVLANVYANTHQFALLKRTSDTTLSISRQAHNSTAMAYGYYTQALLYNAIDNDETVIKYCLMGIKEAEQIPDPYITAKAYYLLYVLNSNWNNVRKVNTYAQEATRNALHAGDYNLLSNCYVALSVAAEYNYNALKSNDRRDSIIYYLKKVEAIYRQHPKEVAPKTYAIACINIANYYFNYFPETDKVARINAIQYANLTQTVMKHAINGEEIFASSLGLLSEYAKREKNYQLAEMYLLEAYSMMSAQQSPYYYTLVNVISSLAKLYEQTGNYPEALKFQKKVAAYNTKLFDQKQALSAQKLEIQYETEKKNHEVQILREREQYSRIQRYLYIGITMVSLLGLVFMFRSYHFKLRYSLQREKQLHLEKQETELLMKLEKEEQSRLKAEQQLLEAQQLQLQKEMMANQLQLEHKKDVLSQIKEKLHDNPLNINKIWNEELMLDNDFEDAKLQIQQVHPNFFYLLNGMTQQKLTSLDLKHCAYLHLKMDTKKIAAILHIEPKSVRMSRYRIKQKLGLSKEDDLNLFLQNLA